MHHTLSVSPHSGIDIEQFSLVLDFSYQVSKEGNSSDVNLLQVKQRMAFLHEN